jgi:peptide deformylase
MAVRRILQLGDPLLRERSEAVAHCTDAAEALGDLRDTLHRFQETHGFGRGISAVQIGMLQRVIYLEFEGTAYGLINPRISHWSDHRFVLWDDCFSFPNLMVKLERSVAIDLIYLDEEGRERTLAAAGALSELIQHEMDHLDGILAIDRALDRNSFATREEWLRQKSEPRRGTDAS